MRAVTVLLGVGMIALASGCGPASSPEASTELATVDAPQAPPPVQDDASLRALAARALSDQRLYAPAGDNAIEHYLALRSRIPGDDGIETALLELLPYAQIAAEQATARGDWNEAGRLIDLVALADARLPAVKRLRDGLVAAQAEARRAEEAEARARDEALAVQPASPTGNAPETVEPVPVLLPPAPAPAPAQTVTASAPAAVPATRPTPAEPPTLLDAPQPRYPLMALRRKLEGEVLLELRIAADGRVARVSVVSATPPGLFDDAAVSAAERWRFAPSPAAVTMRQVMRFRLPEAAAGRGS